MRFLDEAGFEGLLTELRARGFDLVGPTVRDSAIVLDHIQNTGELPRGVGVEQDAGRYRLVERPGDRRFFAFAHGPDSAKRFLFPSREVILQIERDGGRMRAAASDEPAPRYAFLGLRACDLNAVRIQDRVFSHDPFYTERRSRAFIVAVNCEEPGGTCFCASMGAGPHCGEGFDLSLTEVDGGFLVESGSWEGGEILLSIGSREATDAEAEEGARLVREAATKMGRQVEADGLHELLASNRENPEWEAIAEICLVCGNCTAACPTCFCHDVVDASDIAGQTATRTREWASCFSEEFSHIAGGEVRSSRSSRYRQWLTHKFSGWFDQFGVSGCVGCGRCITWCPVGIDVTRELEKIRATDQREEVAVR
jgi:sulfhydrogenase subunit beta (sulfur reductase)